MSKAVLSSGAILLVLAASLVPPVAAADIHWCQPLTVSVNPSVFYPKEMTRVQIILTNGVQETLDIQSFGVAFSWNQKLDLDPVMIAGGKSISFYSNFTMAETPAGVKSASLSIYGKTSVDWFAETCTKEINGWPQVTERPPLTVVLIAPTSTAKVGEPVRFEASIAGGTPPYSANWTFGDGATAVGMKVEHEYWSFGDFGVKVVVRDDLGRQAQDSYTVSIPDPAGGNGVGQPALDLFGFVSMVALLVILGILIGLAVARRRARPSAPATPPSYRPADAPAPAPFPMERLAARPPPSMTSRPEQRPPRGAGTAEPKSPAAVPVKRPAGDDGTKLIERLREKQAREAGRSGKFDAYKPAVITSTGAAKAVRATEPKKPEY